MNGLLEQQLERYAPRGEQEQQTREVMLHCLRTRPDILTREDPLAHFTASAWIVDPSRTRVLMVWHNLYRSWSWIGGHVDGEEDLFGVVQREIAEETGLTALTPLCSGIYGIHILTVEGHHKRGRYISPHLHLDVEYLFEAREDAPLRVKEDENSAVGWIPMAELSRYVTEEKMLPIYAGLNERLAGLP